MFLNQVAIRDIWLVAFDYKY